MKTLLFTSEDRPSYPVGMNILKAQAYIEAILPLLKEEIQEKNVNLWVRGSSGAIIGALLAVKLSNNTKLCHVKKQGENAHCTMSLHNLSAINIIIDDFIAKGDTVNEIYKEMNKEYIKLVDILIVYDINYIAKINFIPTTLIVNKESEHTSDMFISSY